MTRQRETVHIPFLRDKATIVTYPSGFRLVYVPKAGEVFNISTWVRTGSIHEDDAINGISHFLEHLMFKGTERFKPGEFDRAMESMGAVINAATWKDFTFYYVTGPKGPEGQNFTKALDMHADMMTRSTLPDEEIGPQYDPDADYTGEKRERSVVIEEIGMREDQPWTKVYNTLNHMMYPQGHPYQRDVIGTRQIIGNIPRQTIVDYYSKWYSPHNFTTIVVGDFDLATLENEVEAAFRFRPVEEAHCLESSLAIPTSGKRDAVITGDFTTSFFIMGFHGPAPRDFEETAALDVISHALGEGRSARMVQELVEKPHDGLFNFVGTGQSTFKLGNVFFIQGNFNEAEPDNALAKVKEQLQLLLTTQPLTQDELTRAIKKLKVDFAETSETASGIAETIGESLTVVGDINAYLGYLPVLEGLTVEKVNAVAKKYLALEKAYTTVLVPDKALQPA